ncbi:MAG: Bug family tripartite tricarboxylate transporter substrate binding protein [Burkholderiales bacterium]
MGRLWPVLWVGLVSMHATPLAAQDFPVKPIRWVLGFAIGGAPDNIARVVALQLTVQLGQSVVMDNRPGANGIVGAELVANSNPDGYTLLVTSASFAVNPSVYKKLPFDPIKSFAPVTNLASSPGMLMLVNATSPVQNVQQLIDLAKKPGSRLAYGSSGVGNATHLAAELFNARAGTKLVHIPYRGGGLVANALLANEIQVFFTNPATIISQVKAGRVRAIAYNHTSRSPLLPDVPTMIEGGVKGMEMDPGWYGVLAPAATPRAILSKLHSEIRTALFHPVVKERLAGLGVEPVGNPPAEFRAFLVRAIKRAGELTKIAGIQPE